MLSETSSSILHISISVLRSQRLPMKKMKNPPCWTEASSSPSANKEQARFTQHRHTVCLDKACSGIKYI